MKLLRIVPLLSMLNGCSETFEYRQNHTSRITSGAEIAESRFVIADVPDQGAFYKMTDEVAKDNGGADRAGSPTGTPVGDKVTNYVLITPSGNEMLVSQSASLDACFGPLHRVGNRVPAVQ